MEVYKKRYDVYDFPFSVRGVVEMGKQGRVYTLFPFILELVGNLQKIFLRSLENVCKKWCRLAHTHHMHEGSFLARGCKDKSVLARTFMWHIMQLNFPRG